MNRLRVPLGVIVGVWLMSAVSGVDAQVSTQESASIIVFPKVVADGSWDTTIQIANAANRPTRAFCNYVNAQLTIPELPENSISNPRLWINTDFSLSLARQQPTHWVVSRGRQGGVTDTCSAASLNCDAAGFFPSRVPAVAENFVGELVCVEVDASGAPWTGNGLRGQATLTNLVTGEVVKYPAVGLAGFPSNDADGRLCLGGESSDGCLLGAEYAACPNRWTMSHPADFDDRSADGNASRTRLTVVPCTQDFDSSIPGSVVLGFTVTNEFEQTFSVSQSVQCWADFELGQLNDLFDRDTIGGDWLQTEIRAARPTDGGIMLVQQTEHEMPRPQAFSAVATTPHQVSNGGNGDLIVLPAEVIQ